MKGSPHSIPCQNLEVSGFITLTWARTEGIEHRQKKNQHENFTHEVKRATPLTFQQANRQNEKQFLSIYKYIHVPSLLNIMEVVKTQTTFILPPTLQPLNCTYKGHVVTSRKFLILLFGYTLCLY